MDSYQAGMGLFAIMASMGLVIFLIAVVAYVFSSLGLMTMAKNKGIENPWLAWIPIANLYILAKLLGTLKIGSWEVPKLELVLPLAPVALMVLSWIPVIGQLLSLAYGVFMIIVIYNLFKLYRPNSAVLFTILSCIGLFWIFIFIIRNDTPVLAA